MESKAYKTLIRQESAELVINKSRFLCHGCPAETEDEALDFLKRIRARYQDATHNCYAYSIGANAGIMRYSDDGEPGGTAGLPMMEVIKARRITNCIVVITRYFGGVLLGAGGLVRAYSQGTALAIDTCGVGTVYPTKRLQVTLSYPLLSKCEYFLKSQPVLLEDKVFSDVVTLKLLVRAQDEAALIKQMQSTLDGKAEIALLGEEYKAWDE